MNTKKRKFFSSYDPEGDHQDVFKIKNGKQGTKNRLAKIGRSHNPPRHINSSKNNSAPAESAPQYRASEPADTYASGRAASIVSLPADAMPTPANDQSQQSRLSGFHEVPVALIYNNKWWPTVIQAITPIDEVERLRTTLRNIYKFYPNQCPFSGDMPEGLGYVAGNLDDNLGNLESSLLKKGYTVSMIDASDKSIAGRSFDLSSTLATENPSLKQKVYNTLGDYL